jgi:hypothetical protein
MKSPRKISKSRGWLEIRDQGSNAKQGTIVVFLVGEQHDARKRQSKELYHPRELQRKNSGAGKRQFSKNAYA